MKTLLLGLLLAASLAVHAYSQLPVPLTGSLCPTGYYRNNGYCVALNERSKPAVPLVGTLCPTGYYRNNGYCLKNK
ncbi:MAG: hypothetical protein IPN92_07730 [Chromatiaceae bacterium]|nr:hypothetical protein [Chromatiaceae bacterium]